MNKYKLIPCVGNGVILVLPSGKELYISEIQSKRRVDRSKVNIVSKMTDYDVINVSRKDSVNSIDLILDYEF